VTAGGVTGVLGGAGVATLGVGATVHPATHSETIKKLQWCNRLRHPTMWLILLEALLAGALLVFIVWWTMFHKPKKKE